MPDFCNSPHPDSPAGRAEPLPEWEHEFLERQRDEQDPPMDTAGCVQVKDDNGEILGPFCKAASQSSLARRLSALQEIQATVVNLLTALDEGNTGLAHAMGRVIRETASSDAGLEAVPYDDALLTVVTELQDLVSAEPAALLEQAQAACRALTSAGWVLVRQENLP